MSIYPSDGWITGSTRVTVIGVNFFEGLDVVFGTVPVQSEVNLTSLSLSVTLPNPLWSAHPRMFSCYT